VRKLAFLLLAIPLVAPAQTVHSYIDIQDQQCVWRAGDDAAWASPDLDDSSWTPFSRRAAPNHGLRIWMRCHVSLAQFQSLPGPAIQVETRSSYELYFNGRLIGASGNLRTGNFNENAILTYPVAGGFSGSSPAVIALRQTYIEIDPRQGGGFASLRVGSADVLGALRHSAIVSRLAPQLPYLVGYLILGILGIAELGLFYYDRSRRDLLLLSIVCVLYALLRIDVLATSALLDFSFSQYAILWLAGVLAGPFQVLFIYAIGRRRVPVFFWIPMVLGTGAVYLDMLARFLPLAQLEWFEKTAAYRLLVIFYPCVLLMAFAPFAALLPFSRLPRRMRLLASLCLVWGVADIVYFATQLTVLNIPGIPNVFEVWRSALLEARAVTTLVVLLALLLLLFRDQHLMVEERAVLAGELQAAGEIQRMLAPVKIDTAPGLQIEVAFRPMREVGGDFYLCRVLPNGHQRILLGDVSGKGAAAAMAATLLLGAAEERHSDSPVELLSHMNRVLCRAHLGGFATCLCVDLAPDGELTLANAGHLSPYRGGVEVETAGGLPLGITTNAEFAASQLTLCIGETFTFVSDGVVEARDPQGELFGFERTAAISTQAAEEIARTAQQFGQEDDITVLTVWSMPA
jgi:sigma-B regulation protein RsbU (phosphoserine phosphatase)